MERGQGSRAESCVVIGAVWLLAFDDPALRIVVGGALVAGVVGLILVFVQVARTARGHYDA